MNNYTNTAQNNIIEPFSFNHFMERLLNNLKNQPDEIFNNFPINITYSWLVSMIKKNGAIYDKYVRSTLDFQYHIPWFILSSSILSRINNDNKYIENINITLKYLLKIRYKVNERSNSFIGIPLSLSLLFISDIDISNKLKSYIHNIRLYPAYGSESSANNFYCLKMLALLLKSKIISVTLSVQELDFINNIVNKKLSGWQYPDGIFYDKPYTSECKNGVPHLTYHATMWMTIIFSGILLNDEKLIKRSRLAFHVLESVTSPSGEISYGRSNNAIFGYSSAILACTLHSIMEPEYKNELLNYRNKLMNVMLKNRDEDGHFYIVPNSYEKKRCGFDNYMFVTVYNSFALALLLLSHLIIPFSMDPQ